MRTAYVYRNMPLEGQGTYVRRKDVGCRVCAMLVLALCECVGSRGKGVWMLWCLTYGGSEGTSFELLHVGLPLGFQVSTVYLRRC